jgi:hypothetical protein
MRALLCRLRVHSWDYNRDEQGRTFLSCRCGAQRLG